MFGYKYLKTILISKISKQNALKFHLKITKKQKNVIYLGKKKFKNIDMYLKLKPNVL